MRVLKWLLGFLVTLTVLILAAVIIVPMVFDPNDYRDDITRLVNEKTGRDLKLNGELKVSVFPWVGIRTQGLTFSQPPQIGGEMMSVETAQLRVKFTPLLSRQVHIDTIILESPKLHLVTLEGGIDSFSGLSTTADDGSTEDITTDDGAGAAVALVVQGLELTEGALLIEDRAANSTTQVSGLNLITGNLLGDELAEVSASGQISMSDSPDAIAFQLESQMQVDVDTLSVKVRELSAKVTQAQMEAVLDIDSVDVVDSSTISLKGTQVNLSGPIEAGLAIPDVTADLESQKANIPELVIEAGGFKAILAELVAANFIDAPTASGRLSIPRFNVQKFLKDLDVDYQTTDPAALKSVGLEAAFSGGLESAQVKDLVLTLDDSTLKGGATVSDFENPSAEFDLQLTTLDLDRYLPPTTDDAGADDEAVSGAEALAVPMAMFKEINANGQFKAETLIASGLTLDNIDVQVRSEQGSVTITPTASLYDGTLDGQIAYSEEGDTAKLAVKNEVDLVELGKMLNAAEVTDQLTGIGSLLVDLVVTEVNGVQNNQGVIKLQAKDGSIQGVDVKGMIDSAYAQYQSLSGKQPADSQEGQSKSSDETKFAELFGTFNVNNNIITNDDFTLQAPLFRVGGEGTIDIEKQVLNYLVEVKVVASTEGQGGEAIDKLSGIPIPIRFTGSLTEPSYSIDFKRLYKGLFAKEVDRKKGELLKEKFDIEGGEELSTKDVLKGILGRKLDKKDKRKAQERPLQERDASSGETVQEAPKDTRTEKEKAKDDLKKKLLDSIFD